MDVALLVVQIITTVIQAISLIFLIFYVIKTAEMATATKRAAEASERSLDELKEARDQEVAPYVVVYFEGQDQSIFLVVKNVGKSIATNIALEFNPSLGSIIPGFDEMEIVKSGISFLPPNYEVKVRYTAKVQMHQGSPLLDVTYDVKVSYYGGLKPEQRQLQYTINFQYFKDAL